METIFVYKTMIHINLKSCKTVEWAKQNVQ